MAQEKWEYMTEFVWADVNGQGVIEYMKKRWPSFKPDKYSPETMVLALNKRGEAGWELVSMQPVRACNDSKVSVGSEVATHIYFCAFKRRINE